MLCDLFFTQHYKLNYSTLLLYHVCLCYNEMDFNRILYFIPLCWHYHTVFKETFSYKTN